MKKFLTDLGTQAWRTRSARYAAAKRLKRRELFSTVSLAFFSAITVALAMMQRIYVVSGSRQDNFVTLLSGVLGIFLLATSLIEWGAANGAKSEALFRNAEELNAFQGSVTLTIAKIDAGLTLSWEQAAALQAEYEAVKARCATNHSTVDDVYFLAQHRTAVEFKTAAGKPRFGLFKSAWSIFVWQTSSLWYFAILWIIVILALFEVWALQAAK